MSFSFASCGSVSVDRWRRHLALAYALLFGNELGTLHQLLFFCCPSKQLRLNGIDLLACPLFTKPKQCAGMLPVWNSHWLFLFVSLSISVSSHRFSLFPYFTVTHTHTKVRARKISSLVSFVLYCCFGFQAVCLEGLTALCFECLVCRSYPDTVKHSCGRHKPAAQPHDYVVSSSQSAAGEREVWDTIAGVSRCQLHSFQSVWWHPYRCN